MIASSIIITLYFIFGQWTATKHSVSARVLADVQPVGNFLVGNCGTNFPDVKDLLQQMSARIDQVIETIDASSIDMTDQYYAFFDGVEQRIIRGILASMSDGNDVPTNNPTPGYLQRPTLVCFDPRAPRHKIWATKCQTGVAAIWIADTQLTILCPGFMNLKLEPTKQDCSTAIDRGTYLSGPALMTTKVTVLIQALTHMYIPGKVLSPEVHGLNPCMSLSEFQSPLNPQNYAFFIGNTIANCDCWQGTQYRGDRKLLAINNDLSNSNGTATLPLNPDCGTDALEVELGLCPARAN